MESGFCGASGSDGHGRGKQNLEPEKGLGQGFGLTEAQHLAWGWHGCGGCTVPVWDRHHPDPFSCSGCRFPILGKTVPKEIAGGGHLGAAPLDTAMPGLAEAGAEQDGCRGRGAGSAAGCGFLALGARRRRPRAARVPEAAKLKSD